MRQKETAGTQTSPQEVWEPIVSDLDDLMPRMSGAPKTETGTDFNAGMAQLDELEAAFRSDPEPRALTGIPRYGVELVGLNPDRHYTLVNMGAGHNMEQISPAMYLEAGYVVERWSDNPLEPGALRFKGAPHGRKGEPITRYGHVLMSIDKKLAKAAYEAEQRKIDDVHRAVYDKDADIKRAKERINDMSVSEEHMRVSKWNGTMADLKNA